MENTPEQPVRTPIEASKGFLKGWGDNVVLRLNIVNVAVDGFLAGMNLAQGHNEGALLCGVAAGCWTATSILKGLSMHAKANEK